MKWISGVAASAVLFSLSLASSHAADTDNQIDIVAVPSSFAPNTITLHAGVKTILVFTRTQGAHIIESSALGIPHTLLVSGHDTSVAVTPAKPGTYVLHCELPCGDQHDKMTLTIVVTS